jgi:hypothetical protein
LRLWRGEPILEIGRSEFAYLAGAIMGTYSTEKEIIDFLRFLKRLVLPIEREGNKGLREFLGFSF